MKFHLKNNGQYYVQQKMQRTLKKTYKILLTLSLSYAMGTQFIPISFAVATELQHMQSMDLQKQLHFAPSVATMRALLPNNINDLQDKNLLKALVKSVSGAFMEYPGIIKQGDDVSSSSIDDACKAIEVIMPDIVKSNNLRLSNDLFMNTNKKNNNNGDKAYTQEQTINYLIKAGYLTAFNSIPSSVESLRYIPIDEDITKTLSEEVKRELAGSEIVAPVRWNTNVYLLKQIQKEGDNKYITKEQQEKVNQRLTGLEGHTNKLKQIRDELRQKLSIHINQLLPDDISKLDSMLGKDMADLLKRGERHIELLNLPEAKLYELKYFLDAVNSSRITALTRDTKILKQTHGELIQKLNTHLNKLLPEDLEKLKAKVISSTGDKLIVGKRISELNLTPAELYEIKYALDDELQQTVASNSSKVTILEKTFNTAEEMVKKLEAGKAAIDDAENTINGIKNVTIQSIDAKQQELVNQVETAISKKQDAATALIGTKQTEAINSIENKQKLVETTITEKKDEAIRDAGTAITTHQDAAIALVDTKQTEAINAIDAKQKEVVNAVETDIKVKKDTVVKAIEDKQKEAIESVEDIIQEQKDKVVWELMSLEKKEMQISENHVQKLKEEQEQLEKRIVKLEHKINKVSNDEQQLSEQEAQELKAQCDALKQELTKLQERLNEADQEGRQTSEAEVKQLKEEQGKLANELQTVKNEKIAEAQKAQEKKKVKKEKKAQEEQKIIEEKIAQEVKQKEELERTNNNIARSQDVASNAATSIKSMEMLSHAVNLAVSQLVGDRISNITQVDSSKEKNIVAQANKNKIVASGSQVAHAGTLLKPKSWDIWGSAYIGTISQSAVKDHRATSRTGLHGFVLGIDKIFGYNILGFAISYGQSRTAYTVPQLSANSFTTSYNPSHHINIEQQNSYYQASAYVRYSPDDLFFIKLLGSLGTYAQDAKINNLFSRSDSNATSGYSVNATIGYHYYLSEKLVLTPTLGIFHNYLNIPDQSNTNTNSSSHENIIINKLDAIIGLNVKLISTSNMANNNIRIIPEATAAVKFRIHESHEEKAQVPVALIPSSDDLLSNVAAAPSPSIQVGAKLTIGNDTVLFGIYGHADIAIKYHALTCGINMRLYL